ncbi:MAG: hypothetical protein JO007_19115 [Alphaproteobacteria bacterium]|nr:hypothetical protein [Alphaproteobacteria bacterium]
MLSNKIMAAAAVLLLSVSAAFAQEMGPEARAVLQACRPDIAHFCG